NSLRSEVTRYSRLASRHFLRKNASSPTKTYTGRNFLASTSETKRSVCAKARIRTPPVHWKPNCARTREKAAQRRESLPQKNCLAPAKFDIARETRMKDSDTVYGRRRHSMTRSYSQSRVP